MGGLSKGREHTTHTTGDEKRREAEKERRREVGSTVEGVAVEERDEQLG